MNKKRDLEEQIKEAKKNFKENSKEILVVSHFDTDGISSAAIMTQALKKLDLKFTIKIVKLLTDQVISKLPKNKLILMLDLGSSSFENFQKHKIKNIIILDHHEIVQKVPEEITIVNPELDKGQKISAAGVVYLFCKELDKTNNEFAKLAVLGMIGDRCEKELDKLNHNILEDGAVKRKRGLMIYPSTRPINRVLEFSYSPYIKGVTGDTQGVLELLREIGQTPNKGKYKSLLELKDSEMEKLVTAIMLRNPKAKSKEIIGDIFLLKFFNKLEDARELSAKINACSRLGESYLALQYCMENSKSKKDAEKIYIRYKQSIVQALKKLEEIEKIQGKKYIIFNAKNKVPDTIIGTALSILSSSAIYEKNTILIGMAYDNETKTIKVSARRTGEKSRNLREVLTGAMGEIPGEVGGHPAAAGCSFSQDFEEEFLENLKKVLELEVVKI